MSNSCPTNIRQNSVKNKFRDDNVNLKVSKTVTGGMSNSDDMFDFTVNIKGAETGHEYRTKKNGTYDDSLSLTTNDEGNGTLTFKLKHGENKIRQEIAFYRGEHPESCQLRIFTSGSAGIEIKNLKVDFLTVTRDSSILVWITAKIMQVVLFLVLSYLIIYVWLRIKRREPGKRTGRSS